MYDMSLGPPIAPHDSFPARPYCLWVAGKSAKRKRTANATAAREKKLRAAMARGACPEEAHERAREDFRRAARVEARVHAALGAEVSADRVGVAAQQERGRKRLLPRPLTCTNPREFVASMVWG